MSKRAPFGPVAPEEKSRESGWLRFVAPRPDTVGVRAAKRLVWRIAGECGAWIVVLAVALALLAPVAAFAVAGGWAIYTYAHALVTLWQNIKSYQLSNLAPLLDSLSLGTRVALASAGYFALLAALIVLMAGLLGKRWRRLFLFPGIAFTLPSALAFFFGFHLSLDVLAAPSGLSAPAQTALLVYVLLDAIVLAAALVDVSPRQRRARRMSGMRWVSQIPWIPWMPKRRRTPSAPLAPVHFGPSGPLAAHQEAAAAARIVPPATSPEGAIPAATAGAELAAGVPTAPATPAVKSQREASAPSSAATGDMAPELLPLAPVLTDEKADGKGAKGVDVDIADGVLSPLAPAS